MKLGIDVVERSIFSGDWVTATVEDRDGNVLGEQTAPIVDGATFDQRAAVVRAAVEDALRAGGKDQ